MYYSVQAYFAKLYGSISPSPYIRSMIAVGVGTILINVILVATRFKRVPEDEVRTEPDEEIVKYTAELTV